MFRFIGLIWDCSSEAQTQAAQTLARRILGSSEWRAIASSKDLKVMCAGERGRASEAYPLNDGAGAVLGTIFTRSDQPSRSRPHNGFAFDAAATDRIVRSAGRSLIDDYWGRYVAFVKDPRSGDRWVVRNPAGNMPCYLTTHAGVHIAFSYLGDSLQLGLQFSINWRFIKARVGMGHTPWDENALNEVRELHEGECIEFARGNVTRSFYWHPFDIARRVRVEDPVRAASALRDTTKACVHSWASCYSSIIHRISGGLDSSIVLACLQDAPARPLITCLTYYWRGANSADERPYARFAAARAGCELVEEERSADRMGLEQLRDVGPSVDPFAHLAALETSPYERHLASLRRATAVFNGDLGDSLFCKHDMELAVVDYARLHGVRPRLFRVAAEVAPLVDTSVWQLLRRGIRQGALSRNSEPGSGLIAERTLVNPDLARSLAGTSIPVHPWYRPASDIPPGKLLHIRTVLGYPEFFYVPGGQADDPEQVCPFRAEPLIELCLQIPSFTHLLGGRERGLARAAFAGDVPKEILIRYWKGRPGRVARDALMRNAALARELLLDGILMKERMLNRQRVEDALFFRVKRQGSYELEVFEFLLLESWLRARSSVPQRAAAA